MALYVLSGIVCCCYYTLSILAIDPSLPSLATLAKPHGPLMTSDDIRMLANQSSRSGASDAASIAGRTMSMSFGAAAAPLAE